jgi:hypothetical protein
MITVTGTRRAATATAAQQPVLRITYTIKTG